MKHSLILLLILVLIPVFLFSQSQDTISGNENRKSDSGKTEVPLNTPQNDSAQNQAVDTTIDSALIRLDSMRRIALKDIMPIEKNPTERALDQLRWTNIKAQPVFFVSEEKRHEGKEGFFYAFCALLFLIGLFKTFYQNYFSNLFRVYFNTSLRQGQLSEQLEQAKLPNLIMNIFFVILGGTFLWQLLDPDVKNRLDAGLMLQICMGAIAAIYLFKFIFLKFIGWITGRSPETDHYIFIIFLLNKIIGLLLIPFIILLEFGQEDWFPIVRNFGLLTLVALILTRYFKSYGLLRQKIALKPFHFLLYIAGAEILPIMLLYKASLDFFVK